MAEGFEIIEKLAVLNIPKETVDKVPARLCKEYHIFPVEETESYFKIAMANPYDIQAIDDIQLMLKEGKIAKTTVEEIEAAITKILGVGGATFKFDDKKEEEEEKLHCLNQGPEEIDVVEAADDAIVVNFVNQIMQEAVKMRAQIFMLSLCRKI